MSRLAVELDRLGELVDRMALFEAQLERVRDEVDARIRALHVSWTGEAATRQASAHAQWRTGAAEVHHVLVALRSIAAGAHANYAAAAVANRRMWAAG